VCVQGPTENRQGEWAPWLNIIIFFFFAIFWTKVLFTAKTFEGSKSRVNFADNLSVCGEP